MVPRIFLQIYRNSFHTLQPFFKLRIRISRLNLDKKPLVHCQFPHAVTVLWQDSDNVVTILSPTVLVALVEGYTTVDLCHLHSYIVTMCYWQGCESSSFQLISSFMKISFVSKCQLFLLFSAYFWHFTLISRCFSSFFRTWPLVPLGYLFAAHVVTL